MYGPFPSRACASAFAAAAGSAVTALEQVAGRLHIPDDLVRAAVSNHLRHPGEVLFGDMEPGAALDKALAMSPAEVRSKMAMSKLSWTWTDEAPALATCAFLPRRNP